MIIEFKEPMVSISKSQFDKRVAEAKTEVARGIFEELERIGLVLPYDDYLELKKKYTEGE